MRLRARVATNLRRHRTERGLTQEQLAIEAGLDRNYVGMLEREENSPTVDTLEKLCNVLQINPASLFT